jgi:hypothetical protein
VEREWNYLLFRDGVEGPDVVLQGDGSEGEKIKITFCSGMV